MRPGEVVAMPDVPTHERDKPFHFWLQEYIEGKEEEYEIKRTFGVPIPVMRRVLGGEYGRTQLFPTGGADRVEVHWVAGYKPDIAQVHKDDEEFFVQVYSNDQPVYLIEDVKLYRTRTVAVTLDNNKYLATTELRVWERAHRTHHGLVVENVTDKRFEVTLRY